jgi:hypothetical protein
MVKVLPSTANSVGAVRQHLAYVGRQGDVELQTDDGQRLQDRDAVADLIQDWNLDLAECQSGLGGLKGQRAPRLVHKLVFSMPAGTPADKVLLATQGFCREQLALKHRCVMALHADEPHPHVHVIIKAISEQGERLNIRKATLREWREEFASQLRRVGVAATATPRFVARRNALEKIRCHLSRRSTRRIHPHARPDRGCGNCTTRSGPNQ